MRCTEGPFGSSVWRLVNGMRVRELEELSTFVEGSSALGPSIRLRVHLPPLRHFPQSVTGLVVKKPTKWYIESSV